MTMSLAGQMMTKQEKLSVIRAERRCESADAGKMVPLGDRAMSRELTYIHPGGRGGEPGLEIRIEVLGRAPVVTSVLLTAVPGGNGVRSPIEEHRGPA